MRRVLPSAFFSAAMVISFFAAEAQNDRFAYAITDITKDGAGWNALRRIDLQTGAYSEILLNGTDPSLAAYDATSKKQLQLQPDAKWGNLLQTPFSTGVAAAAYDKRHNRLYYTPMFVDQLRYIDLRNMKVYHVSEGAFSGMGNMHNDEAKIITRMVIMPDGNGYAINNDGTSLVRFSTGKKPKIEQLGTLVDDPANNGISIHNRCSSFGGDMICDDAGNLYILTARNHVFKVNVENKMATHLGSVKNLPANFTINGAVVDGDGNLLVSSAVDGKSYFVVNPTDWSASVYEDATNIYKSSDLANSNYLATSRNPREITTISRAEEKFSNHIAVYPNPVLNNRVSIQFNKIPYGDYTIELTDVVGRNVMQRKIAVNNDKEIQSFSLQESNSKGVYMVKVLDANRQSVFTQKVLVK